jgi:hypothetical protein
MFMFFCGRHRREKNAYEKKPKKWILMVREL